MKEGSGSLLEYGRSVPRSETSPVVIGEQEEEGAGTVGGGRCVERLGGEGFSRT